MVIFSPAQYRALEELSRLLGIQLIEEVPAVLLQRTSDP